MAKQKGFRVSNPECDLGQGICKTEKINNLLKVIQLDMAELGAGLCDNKCLFFS